LIAAWQPGKIPEPAFFAWPRDVSPGADLYAHEDTVANSVVDVVATYAILPTELWDWSQGGFVREVGIRQSELLSVRDRQEADAGDARRTDVNLK
jgi:hypothetical protein